MCGSLPKADTIKNYMNSIKQLVDRGLDLHRQIEHAERELADIEIQLAHAALHQEHEPLQDSAREGRRFLARGSATVVPVIFTADKLMGQFVHFSTAHNRIRVVCPEPATLQKFFKFKQIWENTFDDGVKFRKAAHAEFGAQSPAFIAACRALDKDGIPKSDTKILWKESKPI